MLLPGGLLLQLHLPRHVFKCTHHLSCASHRYILRYPERFTKDTTKCRTPADAIIMDDVEKLAKARKKQASLFATKPLRSPASAQVRGRGAGPQLICML